MDKFSHQQDLDLFVHRQNLLRFQKLIDETKDAEQQKQVLKLQAEEFLKFQAEEKSKDELPPRG